MNSFLNQASRDDWTLSPSEARSIQEDLRYRVEISPLPEHIRQIGGVDVGFPKGKARAAIVVLAYPSLEPVERLTAETTVQFPYIQGLLSFREIPAILAAMEQLNPRVDVWLVDGQGIAHPRRIGLASHLGVLLDVPTIGCAKSILTGTVSDVGEERGSTAAILDDGEVIGAAVRTRTGVKPVIISPGHKADLESSIRLVLACHSGYRLPEPTRMAHRLASGTISEIRLKNQ